MADLGMLMISHTPLSDTISAKPCFRIDAKITAFSKQIIYPDSVWTIFKVNSGNWDTISMTHSIGNQWTACIPGQMEGSVISYYIHAEDASNRSSNHPYIGAPDPHKFVIEISENPAIIVSPDTLFFNTINDIMNGKTAMAANYTQQTLEISTIDQSGQNPFSWLVEPAIINLPVSMQPGDSLGLNVKLQLPLPTSSSMMCDTLHIIEGGDIYKVMLCINPMLLTQNKTLSVDAEVRVYPNPTSNIVTFSFYNESNSCVRIEIYSAKGELVAIEESKAFNSGYNSLSWNGRTLGNEELPAGLYFYRFSNGLSCKTGKISILR
jgi:hypothetical protein